MGIQQQTLRIRFTADLAPGVFKFIRSELTKCHIPGPFSRCEVKPVSNLSTATILFVDDDQAMREVVALILGEEGYEVSTAADGIDALVRMRKSHS